MPSLSPSSRRSFWRRSALRPRASARSVSVAFAICVDVTALRTDTMHVSACSTQRTLEASALHRRRPALRQPGMSPLIRAMTA